MQTEHEVFHKLTELLKQCADCADQLGVHRPDQKFLWDIVSQNLNAMRDKVFSIAMQRMN